MSVRRSRKVRAQDEPGPTKQSELSAQLPPRPDSFIGLRSAVIMLAAVVIGLVIGSLAFIAYGNIAGAVIAGLGAFGCAVVATHALIGYHS